MKVDLYRHNDLDGVVSAYVFLKSFNVPYNDVEEHVVDYATPWVNREFSKVAFNVVVDFMFSPNLNEPGVKYFLADHHKSTFTLGYPKDVGNVLWDSSAPSCAGLLYKTFKPNNVDLNLIEEVDIIDSAGYGDPMEPIEAKTDVLKLNLLMYTTAKKNMLKMLFNHSPKEICTYYKPLVDKQIALQYAALDYVKNNASRFGRVGVIDFTGSRMYSRYGLFVVYQDIEYGIIVTRNKLSLTKNNWCYKRETNFDLSEVLFEVAGIGGGHKDAAGVTLRDVNMSKLDLVEQLILRLDE